MVTTRKRSAALAGPAAKKTKAEDGGELEVGETGHAGLEEKGAAGDVSQEAKVAAREDEDTKHVSEKQQDNETDVKPPGASPGGELDEPKHGTLESGHIYFLYRPKVDAEEVGSLDDVSKFHILLLPKGPRVKGHFHRVIEVGKKKLPDPGAKHQVIWGLVEGVGANKGYLKDAFGAYSYETKTKGTRHQPAARPLARGHYILYSPRDELADDPNRTRQRDFKVLLAYQVTTPSPEHFGRIQEAFGLAQEGAIVLQVKDPDVQSSDNPRAANLPRERRAQYPKHLHELFGNRRWIPANPPALLSYPGAELLLLSTPHHLSDALGKDGEHVEHDLEHDSEKEKVGIDQAMKELGMSKNDTNIQGLEGAWA